MIKNLTCIICPRGCALTANIEDGNITVTGNGCPKGSQYAVDECLHPVRTVTSTVRVSNREGTMVSVKTESPVAKDKMPEVMKLIRSAKASAPVKIGDVIIENVFGTNIVASGNVD